MKRLFLLSLAVLLIAGAAWAISIPQSEDAETGPAIWYVPVYNNSGSALSKNDVVVWDFGSSSGDNDNWVTTNTTADTFIVAGVVWPSDIAASDRGTIAVRGVVKVTIDSDGPQPINTAAAGSLLCAGSTAGAGQVCSNNGSDADAFAFTTSNYSTGEASINAYVFGR